MPVPNYFLCKEQDSVQSEPQENFKLIIQSVNL